MDTLILFALLACAVAFVVGIYNRLVRLRNKVRAGFAQVQAELQSRYDLIPNLVASVQSYMTHEQETLEAVVKARNLAAKELKRTDPDRDGGVAGLGLADAELSARMTSLYALMEAHPDLRANQNMMTLQRKLGTIENKVVFSRRAFNDAVNAYNSACETFPGNLFANAFGFQPASFFTVETERALSTPQVSFT